MSMIICMTIKSGIVLDHCQLGSRSVMWIGVSVCSICEFIHIE